MNVLFISLSPRKHSTKWFGSSIEFDAVCFKGSVDFWKKWTHCSAPKKYVRPNGTQNSTLFIWAIWPKFTNRFFDVDRSRQDFLPNLVHIEFSSMAIVWFSNHVAFTKPFSLFLKIYISYLLPFPNKMVPDLLSYSIWIACSRAQRFLFAVSNKKNIVSATIIICVYE